MLAGGSALPLPLNQAAMLALLALRGPLPNAWLARLLFPASTQVSAENNLRQRIHHLNKAVGFDLITGNRQHRALNTEVDHELADPASCLRVDPQALRGRLLGAERFADRADLADAIDAERQNWRARLREALSQVAHEFEAAHRVALALPCALRLVEDDPLSEHAVRLLMRLHYRRGDKGAALDAFDRCKSALYEALGDAPTDETVELAMAIGRQQVPEAAPLPPVPLALQHPPMTVGRSALLAMAAEQMQRGAVVLTGRAGLGKTRVFDELMRIAGIGVVVRIQPGDAMNDLAALGRLAMALLPWLHGAEAQAARGAADGPELQADARDVLLWLAGPRIVRPPRPLQPELLTGWLKQILALALARGVCSIAIEDLHESDVASLELLSRHWQQAHAGSIHWLLSTRDEPLPRALAHWFSDAPALGHPQLALSPLRPAALVEWLGALSLEGIDPEAWARALHAHCGGHPWSIVQILRTLNAQGLLRATLPPPQLPVPADLLAQAARAMDHGDARSQQLAFVAALAGPDFSDRLALRLLGCSATELAVPWRRLETLGVLQGTNFCHDLMRQAVRQAVPSALLPALHGDIAAALTELGAPPATLATHWEVAGHWWLAATEGARAAQLSMDSGLAASARQRWLHAAELFERAGHDAEAFEAEWQGGMHTRAVVSPSEAVIHAENLLGKARTPHQQAQAWCLLSAVRAEQHQSTALAAAREAVRLARQLDDNRLLQMARLREVGALRQTGEGEAALQLLDGMQCELHHLSVHDRQEAGMLYGRALASAGRVNEAAAHFAGLLAQARTAGDRLAGAEVASYAAVSLSVLNRLTESLACTDEAYAMGLATDFDEAQLAVDLLNIAANCADLGQFSRAIDCGERAAATLRAAGSWGWMVSTENLLADIFVRLGRPDLAEQRLAEPPIDAPDWSKAARVAARARLAWANGRSPLDGLQRAAQMLERGGNTFSPALRVRTALELSRWAEPASAAADVERALAWAFQHEQLGLARYARLVQIELALRRADFAAACTAARALEEELGPAPEVDNLYLPELWWAMCRTYDQVGEQQSASLIAQQARVWLQQRVEAHIPEVFVASFLHRNPFNRRLLERTGPVVTRR